MLPPAGELITYGTQRIGKAEKNMQSGELLYSLAHIRLSSNG